MQAIVSQLGMEGMSLKGIDHFLVVAYKKPNYWAGTYMCAVKQQQQQFRQIL